MTVTRLRKSGRVVRAGRQELGGLCRNGSRNGWGQDCAACVPMYTYYLKRREQPRMTRIYTYEEGNRGQEREQSWINGRERRQKTNDEAATIAPRWCPRFAAVPVTNGGGAGAVR